jgi:HAD superfamily hydrolase (TIGR01509 family)
MSPSHPSVAPAQGNLKGTPAAALWDFDGTLADTEPLWIAAEYDLVDRLGGTWSQFHAEQLVGNALIDSGTYILDVTGRHDLAPEWVVQELVGRVAVALQTQEIRWRPGARDLLRSFASAGVPCALVSASYRVLLDAALSQLPPQTFSATVAGDEVSHGKPHPEPYLAACRLLGVQAVDCVVIEDSATGAAAGNAAGAFVLAVPHLVEVPSAARRHRVDSLADLDATTVARLLTLGDG